MKSYEKFVKVFNSFVVLMMDYTFITWYTVIDFLSLLNYVKSSQHYFIFLPGSNISKKNVNLIAVQFGIIFVILT